MCQTQSYEPPRLLKTPSVHNSVVINSCNLLLQTSIGMHLPELVQPVLTCFEDQDARVRYYACESLYNISKVARGAVLVFFNNIFDGLCKVRELGVECVGEQGVRW